MHAVVSCASLLVLLRCATGKPADDHEVKVVMNVTVRREGLPAYYVHIYAPSANQTVPTVFFVTGFGANVGATSYSDLLTRISSKGYIVVALNRLGIPNYHKEARQFLDTLTWAKGGGLHFEMLKRKLSPIPDLDRTVVMAQSSGNHIVGQALSYDCMFAKAFVMIDPVDGYDPYRIVRSQDLITPGIPVNFTIPAIIMDNGLDPQAMPLSPPCMPIQLGSPRFYNAWRGPIWHVNATAFGHVDCLDAAATAWGSWVCRSNPKTDKQVYREHLAATANIFMDAFLNGNPENLALLENSSHFTVNVVLEHDRKGLPDQSMLPSCRNVGEAFNRIFV